MGHFLYEELIEKREFEDLWTLFKQLLTLSHGQVSVERQFLVNKEVVKGFMLSVLLVLEL